MIITLQVLLVLKNVHLSYVLQEQATLSKNFKTIITTNLVLRSSFKIFKLACKVYWALNENFFYYKLQTEEEGTDHHAQIFHRCTEVMTLVQVCNLMYSVFLLFPKPLRVTNI